MSMLTEAGHAEKKRHGDKTSTSGSVAPEKPLVHSFGWMVGAIVCFQLAYWKPALSVFILGFAVCAVQLLRARSGRAAFYLGLAMGLGIAAPQLGFFWTIFGAAAIVLWLVLAFWIACFVALGRATLVRAGTYGVLLIPFFWTGLEYFRSELYYLRFSWLNIGYALAGGPLRFLLAGLGMYGVGFCVMALAAAILARPPQRGILIVGVMVFLVLPHAEMWLLGARSKEAGATMRVCAIQVEFPAVFEVVQDLSKALTQHPETDLFMLSEYTFDGPIPNEVTEWCREHGKYLIAGGKDAAPGGNYYNTAFVIGPGGDVVFKQVKSVPIQFFKDGLPAPQQTLWKSPWGPLGVCICYDLSYRRVTDRLVRLGAKGLLVPTMDVADWGERQHKLHGRVAPVRATEYGISIFRVASSGISQFVNADGEVLGAVPYAKQHEVLYGSMWLRRSTLPLDAYLGPVCVMVTGVMIAMWIMPERWKRKTPDPVAGFVK